MTFEALVKKLANNNGVSNDKAVLFIDYLTLSIKESLQHGGEVAIPGFGRFVVRTTKASTPTKGVNAGKTIPESHRIGFRAFGKLQLAVAERKTA